MDLLRSLPIGLYLEQPITWLHGLDARVKLLWLMSFLIAPVLANPIWRLGLVLLLILITISALIPLRVWRKQMGWLLSLSLLVCLITAIAPDGLPVEHQPRLPAQEITFDRQPLTLPPTPVRNPWYNPFGWGEETPEPEETIDSELPQPTDYRYVLFEQGRFTITRRSLDLGIRISTLFFTLIYSTNLYLLTTAPEEIAAGIEELMSPLKRFNIPTTEIALTLTLSLRFIPLVLEEVQNLIRSVRTRAINWKKLGLRGTTKVWFSVVERLLENLLLRAQQIAGGMQVRGFTTPNTHRVQWHPLKLRNGDWVAIAILVGFWGMRFLWGWQV
ncbi:energy-coupling factor transporter transmembrane component T family protein [Laspinema palackyanum]|uniref:energy-coupling factor transporter transmembrane component T family protein n=1 Tax=Laspinema palackyanum TaxID=3231601 RepID=UPI00345CEA2D|nr:energy-coupling factor transporter transmembrane protein EcfT [Laspinema sp. D2c]